MNMKRSWAGLASAAGLTSLVLLVGCTPMVTGQMAEGGINAAKSAFGALSPTTAGADERQRRIQASLNKVNVGDDIDPILEEMGEAPREKSGNAQGYTCYEFPSVYSSTESAVLMAQNGKIVFYGNSRCTEEMNVNNFRAGGKYVGGGATQSSQGVSSGGNGGY
jgi:hypothetical protein